MIDSIISNENGKIFLKNQLKNLSKSGTYLFYGEDEGILMEFALSFAKGLCCLEEKEDFCNRCSNCKKIDKMVYSDLEILENSEGIKIDDIRELEEKTSKSSYEGKKKIFIIKNIGKLRKESSNALLKIIEEPNEDVFFILLNSNLNILPTIKSRSIILKLNKKTAEELGVSRDIYDFFSGNSCDILKYKEQNLNLDKEFEYINIDKAMKKYQETGELKYKIDMYKGIRNFVDNRWNISELDRIQLAEQIIDNCSEKEILNEIIGYFVEYMGAIQGLKERLVMKEMLKSPINLKNYLINFLLEIK